MPLPRLIVLCGLFIGCSLLGAVDRTVSERLSEAEATYEIRVQRIFRTKGHKAVFEEIARDFTERPKPYVKAFYANYLIYAEDYGMKDVFNPVAGYNFASEAAAEGSILGLELVGRAWARGIANRDQKSDELAVKYLHEAAAKGRHTAMSALTRHYFFGMAVTADRLKAEDFARRSAWLGATGGLLDLATWWENPNYGVPNPSRALDLYYEAASLGEKDARVILQKRAAVGNQEAQKFVYLDLIAEYFKGLDVQTTRIRAAVKWLEANSSPHDLRVQLSLAELMMELKGPVFDAAAARAKLERLAKAGHDDARALIATMLWRGIGGPASPETAVAIWRELADKGNARGLNQIGWLHWWGNGEQHGIPKDPQKAFEMCRRSAEGGYWIGVKNVADCYAHGIGTDVNYFLAVKYYEILSVQGFKEGERMRRRILGYIKD